MKNAMIAALAVAFAGCAADWNRWQPGEPPAPYDPSATYLCVGMERSARFGECPGCALDSIGMHGLLSQRYGYSGSLLISEQATKSNVVELLRRGIENTPPDGMFIFCYSGHGGQECLGGEEPGGADEPDEYLCLYDSHMLDDEIWDIVSRCRGRVLMYFDACHSATMYRSVVSDLRPRSGRKGEAMGGDLVKSSGFTMDVGKYVAGTALGLEGRSPAGILCWSGCKESEYSYGDHRGGVMTTSLLKSWRKGKSYGTLWYDVVSRVRSYQPSQHPVQTLVGGGFEASMEAFR